MPTRCQIGIYSLPHNERYISSERLDALQGWDVLLYKHQDGYPENMAPLLEPLVARCAKACGFFDAEYLSAWICHHLIADYIESNKTAAKRYEHIPEDGVDFLGYGISSSMHTDIEYFYKIEPNKLSTYAVTYEDRRQEFNLIDEIEIEV